MKRMAEATEVLKRLESIEAKLGAKGNGWPGWMDLDTLSRYSAIPAETLWRFIKRKRNPMPCSQPGGPKGLVRIHRAITRSSAVTPNREPSWIAQERRAARPGWKKRADKGGRKRIPPSRPVPPAALVWSKSEWEARCGAFVVAAADGRGTGKSDGGSSWRRSKLRPVKSAGRPCWRQ